MAVAKKKRQEDKPMATAAVQIVRLAAKADVSLAELAHFAEADPGFAIRILSLVNSPAFSVRSKVNDVKRAVSMLGIRGMRNVALSLVVTDMVPSGKEGNILLANCLRRAVACRMLGEHFDRIDVDSYFTAGLLLEAGLLPQGRSDLEPVMGIIACPAAHRVLRERSLGRTPHPEKGAEMVQAFGLAAEAVDAIRYHHSDTLPQEQLCQAAWLAERLAAVFESGDLDCNHARAVAAAADLGLNEEETENILARMPEMTVDAARGLKRRMATQPDLEALKLDASRSLVELNSQYEILVRQLEGLLDEKETLTRELRQANERLEHLAHTDGLTGLTNRRSFEEALQRDLARADRDETPVTLLMFDLDHFKNVNDQYGHLVGDEVIRTASAAIKGYVRTGDVPARFGGEEFSVILPNTDSAGGEVVAERIRHEIETAITDTPKGPLKVTISCGVAEIRGPNCYDQGEQLIRSADTALYEAKDNGRNQVAIFSA